MADTNRHPHLHLAPWQMPDDEMPDFEAMEDVRESEAQVDAEARATLDEAVEAQRNYVAEGETHADKQSRALRQYGAMG